mmetsp:Transcript_119035/g.253897  ORF Transcript_119035/g.253897 Transcript_119035/m.253897 type:complete len:200 (+) Transcript_119035:107-706(+)
MALRRPPKCRIRTQTTACHISARRSYRSASEDVLPELRNDMATKPMRHPKRKKRIAKFAYVRGCVLTLLSDSAVAFRFVLLSAAAFALLSTSALLSDSAFALLSASAPALLSDRAVAVLSTSALAVLSTSAFASLARRSAALVCGRWVSTSAASSTWRCKPSWTRETCIEHASSSSVSTHPGSKELTLLQVMMKQMLNN